MQRGDPQVLHKFGYKIASPNPWIHYKKKVLNKHNNKELAINWSVVSLLPGCMYMPFHTWYGVYFTDMTCFHDVKPIMFQQSLVSRCFFLWRLLSVIILDCSAEARKTDLQKSEKKTEQTKKNINCCCVARPEIQHGCLGVHSQVLFSSLALWCILHATLSDAAHLLMDAPRWLPEI